MERDNFSAILSFTGNGHGVVGSALAYYTTQIWFDSRRGKNNILFIPALSPSKMMTTHLVISLAG